MASARSFGQRSAWSFGQRLKLGQRAAGRSAELAAVCRTESARSESKRGAQGRQSVIAHSASLHGHRKDAVAKKSKRAELAQHAQSVRQAYGARVERVDYSPPPLQALTVLLDAACKPTGVQ